MQGLLGTQPQAQQQGNLLGNLFQTPQQARNQSRNRLFQDAIAISQTPNAGAAIAGGLLGEAAGRAMGRVTPEEDRAMQLQGLQDRLAEQGLDPSQDPYGFFTGLASELNSMGMQNEAVQAMMQAREFAPERPDLKNVREVTLEDGTRTLVGTANGTAVEVTGQGMAPLGQRLAGEAPDPEKSVVRVVGGTPEAEQYAANYPNLGLNNLRVGESATIELEDNVPTGVDIDSSLSRGPLPAGTRLVIDPNTGEQRIENIPGGPAEQEIAEQERAAAEKRDAEVQTANIVFEDLQDLENLVENDSILNPVLGLKGLVASYIPGTNRIDAESLSRTIRANLGFDRLQQMRNASPTGGALGAISERELIDLQSTTADLSLSQSKEQLLKNIETIRDQYARILEKANAYPNASDYGFGGSSQSNTQSPQTNQPQRLRYNIDTGEFE